MNTEKTNVVKPITWADIDALPIANNDMTEEELRKLCLDYMTMMLHFTWTPSHQTDLISKGKVTKTFETGKVYGGIPYVAGVMGNLYTAMEYYDEKTGVMDLSQGMETLGQWGNQCSGSTMWAWNRVCTSLNYHSTTNMHEDYGCLRVGNYDYTGEFAHEYYYEVVYTFSGNGALTVGKDYVVSVDKTVIDSMRIASIKKVTDTSPYTLKPTL